MRGCGAGECGWVWVGGWGGLALSAGGEEQAAGGRRPWWGGVGGCRVEGRSARCDALWALPAGAGSRARGLVLGAEWADVKARGASRVAERGGGVSRVGEGGGGISCCPCGRVPTRKAVVRPTHRSGSALDSHRTTPHPPGLVRAGGGGCRKWHRPRLHHTHTPPGLDPTTRPPHPAQTPSHPPAPTWLDVHSKGGGVADRVHRQPCGLEPGILLPQHAAAQQEGCTARGLLVAVVVGVVGGAWFRQSGGCRLPWVGWGAWFRAEPPPHLPQEAVAEQPVM